MHQITTQQRRQNNNIVNEKKSNWFSIEHHRQKEINNNTMRHEWLEKQNGISINADNHVEDDPKCKSNMDYEYHLIHWN